MVRKKRPAKTISPVQPRPIPRDLVITLLSSLSISPTVVYRKVFKSLRSTSSTRPWVGAGDVDRVGTTLMRTSHLRRVGSASFPKKSQLQPIAPTDFTITAVKRFLGICWACSSHPSMSMAGQCRRIQTPSLLRGKGVRLVRRYQISSLRVDDWNFGCNPASVRVPNGCASASVPPDHVHRSQDGPGLKLRSALSSFVYLSCLIRCCLCRV